MLDVRAGGLGVFALTEAGVARIDSPTGAAGRMRPTPGAQALFVGDKAVWAVGSRAFYRIDAQGGVRARTDLPAACATTHALAAFGGSLWVSCGGTAARPGGEVVELRPGDGRVLRRLGFERPGDLIPFNGALRVVDITTENGTGPSTYRLVPVYRNGRVGQPRLFGRAPQTFRGSLTFLDEHYFPIDLAATRDELIVLEGRNWNAEANGVARQGRALRARHDARAQLQRARLRARADERGRLAPAQPARGLAHQPPAGRQPRPAQRAAALAAPRRAHPRRQRQALGDDARPRRRHRRRCASIRPRPDARNRASS